MGSGFRFVFVFLFSMPARIYSHRHWSTEDAPTCSCAYCFTEFYWIRSRVRVPLLDRRTTTDISTQTIKKEEDQLSKSRPPSRKLARGLDSSDANLHQWRPYAEESRVEVNAGWWSSSMIVFYLGWESDDRRRPHVSSFTNLTVYYTCARFG